MSELYYLLSSLPSLDMSEKAPITIERFMEIAQTRLKEKDYHDLELISRIPSEESLETSNKTLQQWYNWEVALRNKLIRNIAGDRGVDPEEFTHEEKDYFSELDRISQDAYFADDPLKREEILDAGRWARITELESGHIYDIDLLFLYKLKLLFCWKWTSRCEENGRKNLEGIIDALYNEDLVKIN